MGIEQNLDKITPVIIVATRRTVHRYGEGVRSLCSPSAAVVAWWWSSACWEFTLGATVGATVGPAVGARLGLL